MAAGKRQLALYVTAAILSLIGLADALYLTIQHVTGNSLQCTIISGCSEVLSSRYAEVAGVPLAAIGAAAYFSVFSLATLAAFGYRIAGTLLTILVAAMFLVSLWLIYLQAFVIRQFCQYCLLSAAITVGLLITALMARRFRYV
ncbi:MAG TPA: vitamin K epoxide reductase family protein [Pyrinomonadaceae bacterium]|nr:vitamin K epoxide reductase family protein [Pyrinomonadaceae bacterium]